MVLGDQKRVELEAGTQLVELGLHVGVLVGAVHLRGLVTAVLLIVCRLFVLIETVCGHFRFVPVDRSQSDWLEDPRVGLAMADGTNLGRLVMQMTSPDPLLVLPQLACS